MGEKTEEPTPRRLRQARKDGDSPVSSYGSQAVAFVLAVALVPGTVRALWAHASRVLVDALASNARPTTASLAQALGSSALAVLALVLPLLTAVAATGALVQLVQTGGVFAPGRLVPSLERLDPGAGFKRLVSPTRIFAVGRAFLAGVLVGALAYSGIRGHVVELARTTGRPWWIRSVVAPVAQGIAWRAALLGLLLGVLDLFITRRAWLRRLRMSKEEVTRELKESEGDPQVKAARERAHRELLSQATLASVRNASVVIVNPTHLACALRYDEKRGDSAPVVVAVGEGDSAAAIARMARAFGVPVLEDVSLARTLVELSIGETIPEALYEAVAAILREVTQPRLASPGSQWPDGSSA